MGNGSAFLVTTFLSERLLVSSLLSQLLVFILSLSTTVLSTELHCVFTLKIHKIFIRHSL